MQELVRAALIISLLWATPLLALDIKYELWRYRPGGSEVVIRPTREPGAVAEIHFRNTWGDTYRRVTHDIELQGHNIQVLLGGPMPDTIWVTPPEGYIAVPPEATTPDGTSTVILIYPLSAIGM